MNPAAPTSVREPRAQRAGVGLGFLLLGVAAGWLLMRLADLVVRLDWAPLSAPFRLLARLPDPQAELGALALGGLTGAVLAAVAAAERLQVVVGDGSVVLRRGWDGVRELHREAVSAAFLDGRTLVLLGPQSQEVAREGSDLRGRDLAAAFTRHGYRWHDEGDPFRQEYRCWVEGAPDLPAVAAHPPRRHGARLDG